MTTGTGKDLRHKQEIQITKERMSKFKSIIIIIQKEASPEKVQIIQ